MGPRDHREKKGETGTGASYSGVERPWERVALPAFIGVEIEIVHNRITHVLTKLRMYTYCSSERSKHPFKR